MTSLQEIRDFIDTADRNLWGHLSIDQKTNLLVSTNDEPIIHDLLTSWKECLKYNKNPPGYKLLIHLMYNFEIDSIGSVESSMTLIYVVINGKRLFSGSR